MIFFLIKWIFLVFFLTSKEFLTWTFIDFCLFFVDYLVIVASNKGLNYVNVLECILSSKKNPTTFRFQSAIELL